jgi:hypothetical protein
MFLRGGIIACPQYLNPADMFIRYYATAALDYVHRSEALAEWSKLAKGETVPLERALGSFDLFVLHDNYGDLLEVSLSQPIGGLAKANCHRYVTFLTILQIASVRSALIWIKCPIEERLLQLSNFFECITLLGLTLTQRTEIYKTTISGLRFRMLTTLLCRYYQLQYFVV